MALRILAVLGVALGAVTGCASNHTDDTLVDFRITGGFAGPSGDTSLQIDTAGAATRTPPRAAPVTIQLDAAALADLNAQIRDAQFPTLAPSYGCLGCVDEAVYEISVALDGAQYHVSVDSDFNASDPQGLQHLVATLHQIAQPALGVD